MIVFGTIAAVSVGVIGVYFEMQEQEAERNAARDTRAPPPATEEHLSVTPTTLPAELLLGPDDLDDLPALALAFEEAAAYGNAAIADPVLIDAVWLHLGEMHGIQERGPLIVSYDDMSYALRMTL